MENSLKCNSINLEIFEALMSKDCLRLLPRLIEDMDENLALNIDKFISNPLLEHFKFSSIQIVEFIKNSKNFHYDKKQKCMKFKKKADLNLLIFKDFKLKGNNNEILNKIEFLKNLIYFSCKLISNNLSKDQIYSQQNEENVLDDKNQINIKESIINFILEKGLKYDNFSSKLQRIQYSQPIKAFQLIFENENSALHAGQFFEELQIQNYFSHFIENIDGKEFIYTSIFAAETLKRRILREMLPEESSLTINNQINFIKYIFQNPNNYSPKDFIFKILSNSSVNNTFKYERIPLNPFKIYKNSILETRLQLNSINAKRNLSMNDIRGKIKNNVNFTESQLNNKGIKRFSNYSTFKEIKTYKINKQNEFLQNSESSTIDNKLNKIENNEKITSNNITPLKNDSMSNSIKIKKISNDRKRSLSQYYSNMKNKFDINFDNINSIQYTNELLGSSFRKFSKNEKFEIKNISQIEFRNEFNNTNLYNNEKSNSSVKTKFSKILIPKEHRFSCNYIDHNLINPMKESLFISNYKIIENEFSKSKEKLKFNQNCINNNIINKYSSEDLVHIFSNLLNSSKFIIPEVFNKMDYEELFSEIGIPIPKTLEHFREKYLNTNMNIENIHNQRKYTTLLTNNYNKKSSVYYKNIKKQRTFSSQYEFGSKFIIFIIFKDFSSNKTRMNKNTNKQNSFSKGNNLGNK